MPTMIKGLLTFDKDAILKRLKIESVRLKAHFNGIMKALKVMPKVIKDDRKRIENLWFKQPETKMVKNKDFDGSDGRTNEIATAATKKEKLHAADLMRTKNELSSINETTFTEVTTIIGQSVTTPLLHRIKKNRRMARSVVTNEKKNENKRQKLMSAHLVMTSTKENFDSILEAKKKLMRIRSCSKNKFQHSGDVAVVVTLSLVEPLFVPVNIHNNLPTLTKNNKL